MNEDVKLVAAAPVPALDAIDEPEAIIDLMLGEQLLSASPDDTGAFDPKNYKAAG